MNFPINQLADAYWIPSAHVTRIHTSKTRPQEILNLVQATRHTESWLGTFDRKDRDQQGHTVFRGSRRHSVLRQAGRLVGRSSGRRLPREPGKAAAGWVFMLLTEAHDPTRLGRGTRSLCQSPQRPRRSGCTAVCDHPRDVARQLVLGGAAVKLFPTCLPVLVRHGTFHLHLLGDGGKLKCCLVVVRSWSLCGLLSPAPWVWSPPVAPGTWAVYAALLLLMLLCHEELPTPIRDHGSSTDPTYEVSLPLWICWRSGGVTRGGPCTGRCTNSSQGSGWKESIGGHQKHVQHHRLGHC